MRKIRFLAIVGGVLAVIALKTWSDMHAIGLVSETLEVPTLRLTGDADLYTPPAVLQLFSRRIKTSTTVILPEVGHSAYWEQPELFNRAVLDFIRRH
jgi:pimeloyl-ACP methyl ester carboxylesterase